MGADNTQRARVQSQPNESQIIHSNSNFSGSLLAQELNNQQLSQFLSTVSESEKNQKFSPLSSEFYLKMASIYQKQENYFKARYWINKFDDLKTSEEEKQIIQRIRQKFIEKFINVRFRTNSVPAIPFAKREGKKPIKPEESLSKTAETAEKTKETQKREAKFDFDQQYRPQLSSEEGKSLAWSGKMQDIMSLKLGTSKKIQTIEYPYTAVGLITCELIVPGSKITNTGTGCLIGKNLVLTAAHTLFNAAYQLLNTSIYYTPSPELSNGTKYKARKTYISPKYIQSQKLDLQDYAVIQLDTEEDLQAQYGSFSYNFDWQHTEAYLHRIQQSPKIENIKIVGYPYRFGNQEFAQISGEAISDANYLVHKMPTRTGVSGAPALQSVDQSLIVRAIHTRDLGRVLQKIKIAVSLRSEMFDKLNRSITTTMSTYDLQFRSHDKTDLKEFKPEDIRILIELVNQRQLRKGTAVQNMMQLMLGGRMIGSKGCEYLAAAHRHQISSKLRNLDLTQCNIGTEACKWLSQAQWHYLVSLNLEKNQINDQGCHYLSSADWYRLQKLYLQQNKVGTQGCKYLDQADWDLTRLHLDKNNIRDSEFKQLAQVEWKTIEKVNLSHNKIGNEGCAHLAYLKQAEKTSAVKWRCLKEIYLCFNEVGKEGCRHLTQAHWPNLEVLDLQGNNVGDQGCRQLALAKWKHLEHLVLSKNKVGPTGCQYLSTALWPSLQRLELSNNLVGLQGCRFLADAKMENWKNLRVVTLYTSKIPNEAASILGQRRIQLQN